ncbi:MAG: amine dehydrogenase large subunit, partial [Gammaproteobacteria bacterium]|nr:amine dehydrogenase large subunit [Gammaproteobacteria bacterium]
MCRVSIGKCLSCLTSLLASLSLLSAASAQITPEEISIETMADPGPNWFISKSEMGGYIFDAESGEMKGLLSLSRRTPAVTTYAPRKEFYAAESYFAREVHGERTDLVAIYDFDNLSPVAEVIIPNHMARLQVRSHLGLMNNGRHLAVMNMNPGHSVSIVDVQDRVFIYEISTPGCAVIMPVAQNDFLQVCGDGTLQLIQLDLSGFEENRVRSDVFFDVIEDAVFDRATPSANGWILSTHAGVIFEVSTDDDDILIEESWSLVSPDEREWRPGGEEFITAHKEYGLLYVLMHEGKVDTHHEPGSEVWVYDLTTRNRVFRLELDGAAQSVMVTQEENPR